MNFHCPLNCQRRAPGAHKNARPIRLVAARNPNVRVEGAETAGRCALEIFEILEGQLYQSGAPDDAAEWTSIHSRGIDVVVDLFGTLDPGVPTEPNSILYIYWPIEDADYLPALGILNVLVDAVVRLIQLGHKVLVHCHMGKSRSGLLNALVVRQARGLRGRDAVALVRTARPGALGNKVFAAYVESLPAPGAS